MKNSSPAPERVRQVTTQGSEVIRCVTLGLKDALHPKLALLSFFVGIVCLLVSVGVFWFFWDEIWHLITPLTAYLLSGWLSWLNKIPHFDAFLGIVFIAVSFILMVVLCSRLILDLILMSRIQKQVLKHYPDLVQEHSSSVLVGIINTLKVLPIMLMAACFLIIPFIGGALFFIVVTFLNIRSLCFDALEGVASTEEIAQITQTKRKSIVLIGLVTAVFPLIPILGFLTPVILGASTTHYCFRRLQELRATSKGDEVVHKLDKLET